MKEIKLTQGKVALVDDEDFEYLNQCKWCVSPQKNGDFYAIRTGKFPSKEIRMHRVIMNAKGRNEIIDHMDGNGLNNQKYNLRICTNAQNLANRKSRKNSTSKYLGVHWYKAGQKWQSQIRKDYKVKHLGFFINEADAARAYNKAAIEIHGEFARLNIIE